MHMGKERLGNWGSTKVGRWSVPRSEGAPGVQDVQGVRTMGSATRSEGVGGTWRRERRAGRREEASRKHGLLQGLGLRVGVEG